MANILETASQWLSDQLDENASSSVAYRRGSLSVTVLASKGKTTLDVANSSDMLVNVEAHDFIITASTIVLNELVSLPLVGDRITETIASKLHSYEVIMFGAEQPYRFCDPYGHKVRIHTKYLGVVTSL